MNLKTIIKEWTKRKTTMWCDFIFQLKNPDFPTKNMPIEAAGKSIKKEPPNSFGIRGLNMATRRIVFKINVL